MTTNALREKAERLRALHAGPRILVLCNVWDAASARIIEAAGFPALATTSAGIANSLGYADGQRISREEMAEAVARITRTVAVPVTADMEAGYGATPESAAETSRAAIAAGAVGMNLEDALEERDFIDIKLQSDRVRAAREAGEQAGVPLVINARTDVYLESVGEPASRFDHTVKRLNAYRAAGADCLFAPCVDDAETIGKLVKAVKGPLNILARPQTAPLAKLERLGVARVSLGSWPMRAVMTAFDRLVRDLRERGTLESLEPGIPYAEMNKLVG